VSLAAGTRLGPYEILAALGAGGMGEVYRARDTKLQREVAVKVLSDALARDPEYLARFEREARALASLEHPNIAAIHGLEESEGVRFLVLELVAGETLAEKLAAGPLPVEEALEISRQIAEALEAAHEKGIIHRDLKPANVKVTPGGRVKVLDFGLAKTIADSGATTSVVATITAAGATRVGSVLGTPAYMSPEQARGKPVDKRTDLWSFGCVVYELLGGRRAFDGETVSDVLVAVLNREPDLAALPRTAPDSVRRLLGRMLEKDAGRRMGDARDARLEIESALADLRSDSRGGRRSRWLFIFPAALILLVAVLFLMRPRSAPTLARQPKLTQITFAEGVEQFPAWSPDGTQLAYTAEVGGVRQIFVKRLAGGEERRATTGGFDGIQPAWSPDGRTILFVRSREAGRRLEPGDVFGQYDGGDIWSIELGSGRQIRLLENAFNPSYSPDGKRIAVDASWAGPRRIWVVGSGGSNPQQITSDVSEAVAHVRPRWSPDGTKIAFQNIERTKFDVRVADVATHQLVWVTNDLFRDLNPAWSPGGKWIYFTSDRTGGLNIWGMPVKPDGGPAGLPQQLTTGAGQDVEIAVAKDGKRLAFAILRQNADLWKLPVSPRTGAAAGAPQEILATTREDSRGAWSPDGRRIAFNSDRAGDMNLWIYDSSDGAPRQLTKGPGGDYQPEWSPDGKRLVFFSARAGNADIWQAEADTGSLKPLTRGASIDINPFFSPDGTHIAYQSDQSGRLEVWIMNADGSGAHQLTRLGVTGHFLRWMPDGKSVLFRCPCGGAPKTLRAPLSAEDPQPVGEIAGGSHMSLSPDASRIMDVVAHKALWVSTLGAGTPEKVFVFEDPDSRIDYPVWSPDGRWVLFDRFRPQGGDVWVMENFE
jgi:Tol biopolymer transport system component/tRNA A-37 threonylcarbamoyl transferase component Bud32